MWKKFAKDYLTFTKKDRAGIYALLFLIAITILLPKLFPFFKKNIQPDPEFEQQIAMLKAAPKDSTQFVQTDFSNFPNNSATSLFYFDPNTATFNDWKRLGISDRTATTIIKYVSKGGKFKTPADLRKIYTLSKADADRLVPYVRISESVQSQTVYETYQQEDPTRERRTYSKILTKVDINNADTTAFKSLPGIGTKLAGRIVSFRQKLGGFVSVEQIGETYFLPDSTFQKIKPHLVLGDAQPVKININTADANLLKSHPYIDYKAANAIVQYRKQHGDFADVAALKNVHLITPELFEKIYPYLSVE